MRANTFHIIKDANSHLVINTIKSHGEITKEQIISYTGLSRPTVINIVKVFMDRNIIEEKGFAESTGGRNPVKIGIKSSSYFAVSIDMEITCIRLSITDLTGESKYFTKWDIKINEKSDNIISNIISEIHKTLNKLKVNSEDLIGISIGLSGTLDEKNGISLSIERLKDWQNVNIKAIFNKEFNATVYSKKRRTFSCACRKISLPSG